MSQRKVAYSLWFALASSFFFALTVLLLFVAKHLFWQLGIISFILALISLIVSCINLKKRIRIKQALLSIFLGLIPFCLIGWALSSMTLHQRRHSKGHGSVYTVNDMRQAALSIQYFAEDTETEIPQQLDKLFQSLYDYEEFPVIFTCYNDPEELKKGLWKDYWGRPISLIVNSSTEYKLISHGYNGQDDQGGKDDIVVSFNPLKIDEIEHLWRQ